MFDKTVLVVDDSIITRQLMRRILVGLGYQKIVEMKNGAEALARATTPSADPVGLIMLDWTMPQLTGIEVLERLRADPVGRRIPVVMVSAESSRQKVAAAIQAGARGYIVKPFNPREIRVKVDEALKVAAIDEPATLAGSLAELGLPALIQLGSATGLTGRLRIVEGGEAAAEIVLDAGEVKHCRYRGLEGDAAFLELAPLRRGTFVFAAGCWPEPRNVTAPTMNLLMEAMRRQDEALRAA
jgi:two-component system chemotaxis response regulator CheY